MIKEIADVAKKELGVSAYAALGIANDFASRIKLPMNMIQNVHFVLEKDKSLTYKYEALQWVPRTMKTKKNTKSKHKPTVYLWDNKVEFL